MQLRHRKGITRGRVNPGGEPRGCSCGVRNDPLVVVHSGQPHILYIASSRAAAPRVQCGVPLSCRTHDVPHTRRGAPETPVKRRRRRHRRHRSCASRTSYKSKKKRVHKADTRSLVFARNRSPPTRGSPVDAPHSSAGGSLRRGFLVCLSVCLSRSGTIISTRGTTQVKSWRPSPEPAQDFRRRHRCLCHLGVRASGPLLVLCCTPQCLHESAEQWRRPAWRQSMGGVAVPWTRSAGLRRPAGVSSARPCTRWG